MKALMVAFVAICTFLGAACSGLEPLDERLAEQVEFESVDLPGRLWDPLFPPLDAGTPVTIRALLTVPATDEPVPAVIIMHGCGGIGGAEMSWVRDLEEAGVATLVVDSFGGRGVGEICSGQETINVASPIVDVYRAAELLDDHPYVDGSRLAVMGFSFGGRAALWAALTRVQRIYDGPTLAGHVAFYPSTCFIRLEREAEVSGGPIRILHGTADDWTPIGQCEDMVGRMAAEGADAALIAYPGALHSFDNPSLASAGKALSPLAVSPRGCTFVERDGQIIDPDTGNVAGVGSPCVERGISYGYDADARAAAHRDLLDFLAEIFDSG